MGLFSLRGLSHEQDEQVCTRSPRTRSSHGSVAPGDYPSLWAAVDSIAPKIGCVPQTLLEWVKREEVDNGQRDGLTTRERERIKALEREGKELRRANDTLKGRTQHRLQPKNGLALVRSFKTGSDQSILR